MWHEETCVRRARCGYKAGLAQRLREFTIGKLLSKLQSHPSFFQAVQHYTDRGYCQQTRPLFTMAAGKVATPLHHEWRHSLQFKGHVTPYCRALLHAIWDFTCSWSTNKQCVRIMYLRGGRSVFYLQYIIIQMVNFSFRRNIWMYKHHQRVCTKMHHILGLLFIPALCSDNLLHFLNGPKWNFFKSGRFTIGIQSNLAQLSTLEFTCIQI